MEDDNPQEETLEFEEEVIEEEGAKDRLKKLRKDLEACRKEKEEYLTGWQRAKADLVNARKDEEKARGDLIKFAEERLLKELLGVADSFEQGMKSGLESGLKNIYRQLESILKAHGVEAIECMGKKFNPAEHEALMREETADKDKDAEVIEEFTRGYTLYGKVLRPARVKVAYHKL